MQQFSEFVLAVNPPDSFLSQSSSVRLPETKKDPICQNNPSKLAPSSSSLRIEAILGTYDFDL
jgi:hypothetical protein